MKSKIALLAILCLPLLGIAQNQVDKQGRKQGAWTKVDKNNRKIYEGTFKDGHEVGVFTYYYPNGAIRMKNTFSEDGKYCSHEVYSEKGRLMATGFYNQKNRDSVWHIYNDDGALVKINRYRMGVKWGRFYTFSPEGDTLEIFTWKDNKREGQARRRTRDGYVEMVYRNGLLDGLVTEYANGKKVEEGVYSNAMRQGEWKRWSNGVLSVKETWRDGMLIKREVWTITSDMPRFVKTSEIAYFYKRGSVTFIMLRNGKMISSNEDIDVYFDKVGEDNFFTVDRKNKVVAAVDCIKGFSKDSEGRTVLKLEPKPDNFTIFVDENKEDGRELIKMVNSFMEEQY